MFLTLQTVDENNLALLHQMQIKAFKPLLEKYQDIKTNPGAESFELVQKKF